jgi:hypothetical protein
VYWLERLLWQANQDVDYKTLERLTRYCDACQKNAQSPDRFKFTIRDDVAFNHSVYINVMYIDGDPLLHVVDEATRFYAARWLNDVSAQHMWDALRAC